MSRIAAEMRKDAHRVFAADKLNGSLMLINRGLSAKPGGKGRWYYETKSIEVTRVAPLSALLRTLR